MKLGNIVGIALLVSVLLSIVVNIFVLRDRFKTENDETTQG